EQRVHLGRIFLIDGEPPNGSVSTLRALRESGRRSLPEARAEIDSRVARTGQRDVATIVYTSGTTGPPKGVVQTHGNHLATLDAALRTGLIHEGDVDFFFLPLAHSFARLVEYLGIAAGTATAFARSIDTLAEDMAA